MEKKLLNNSYGEIMMIFCMLLKLYLESDKEVDDGNDELLVIS